jgi:hypothetical protein
LAPAGGLSWVPPTSDVGAATIKSHHAKKNGPDLAGGIGVEAGTCSLGKSGARISNSLCIVAGDRSGFGAKELQRAPLLVGELGHDEMRLHVAG